MRKIEKAKQFAKDYSLELIILGVGVAGGIVGYRIKGKQIEKAFAKAVKNYPFGTEFHF